VNRAEDRPDRIGRCAVDPREICWVPSRAGEIATQFASHRPWPPHRPSSFRRLLAGHPGGHGLGRGWRMGARQVIGRGIQERLLFASERLACFSASPSLPSGAGPWLDFCSQPGRSGSSARRAFRHRTAAAQQGGCGIEAATGGSPITQVLDSTSENPPAGLTTCRSGPTEGQL